MESNFLLDLILILGFSNLGGIVAIKLKQPAVLGQILAGLLIGPALLGWVHQGEFITNFSELGVLMLMFMAGLETDVAELKRSAGSSTVIAAGGIILPFILGFMAVKLIFKVDSTYEAIFTGIILAATSISITVQVLRDFGKIKEKTGVNILGAAIIDDILGIVLLTVIVGIADPTHGSSPIMVVVKIVVYFILAFATGKIVSILMSKYAKKIASYISPTIISLICCMGFAYVAGMFEVATIIGAYFCGMIFSLIPSARRVDQDISIIAYTIFTPVFFTNIGLSVKLDNLSTIIVPAIAITIAAIIGKVVGCGIAAKVMKFTNEESLQIGVGMIPRGEVALIVANLGKMSGFINDTIFASIIIMMIVTTLITPVMLKKAYGIK